MLALGFPVAVEEDGLHIFSTDFADETHRRVQPLDAGRHRDDFLNDLGSGDRSDQSGSRAGKENAIALRREAMLRFEPRQKLQNFFRLLGVVPLVGLGNDFAGRRGESVLDRGAADVHAADLRAVGARAAASRGVLISIMPGSRMRGAI